MPAGVAALVAIAAALVVVGIGVAACIGIMAVVAGDWQDVARRFPASQRPNGRIYRGQSGRFEGARYNGILMVVPSPYGLYVEVERPFAFRHPALLLPWFAVVAVRQRRLFPFFVRATELTLTGEDERVLWLKGAAARAVNPYVAAAQGGRARDGADEHERR